MTFIVRPLPLRVYSRDSTRKKEVLAVQLMRMHPTFSRSVMVSVDVLALCRTSIHFVQPGVKVNGQYYRDTLPMQGLLPEIRESNSSLFTKTMCIVRCIGLMRQSCY